MAHIGVIGSGFAGLAAAIDLADKGHKVEVIEKNDQLGGRARQFEAEGFKFDMGPSWYWMPDVFEEFFGKYGYKPTDFFDLKELSPAFSIWFGDQDTMLVPSDFDELCKMFESYEKGAGDKLRKFMKDAEYKYERGMNKLVRTSGMSIMEFVDSKIFGDVIRLQLFSSFKKHVHKYFKHPQLRSLMEFPILFLGAMPENTPALYSLMNYAGLKLGTWYPIGGFKMIIKGMIKVAEEKGVKFHTSTTVSSINIENKIAQSISTNKGEMQFDGIVAAADYEHVEQSLLPKEARLYTDDYWDKRVFAPSSLLYYLGVNKKIKKLLHHNLFFHESLDAHAIEIYDKPSWPSKPLFYACVPSITDDDVAPEGSENLFLLMPLAPDLDDPEDKREEYYNVMMDRLEEETGEKIREHVVYKRSFCVSDFKEDYNSYKGNAYGLANTLPQTAIFKPKMFNKNVKNMVFAGQLTVPGPGVPPSLISGQIAAKELLKRLKL